MDPSYFDDAFTRTPEEQLQYSQTQQKQVPAQTITNNLIETANTQQQETFDLLNMSPPHERQSGHPVDTSNSSSRNRPDNLTTSNISTIDQSITNLLDPYATSPTYMPKSVQQKASSATLPINYSVNNISNNSPLREKLPGIYGFFGSKDLPPNPKQITLSDIPTGLDGIPFIFQNRCYSQGVNLMNQYMKLAATAEEKMYYRILKIQCMIKQSMWDKVALEYSIVGNLDKIIMESTKSDAYVPYTLRFLYALTPLLSISSQSKSTVSTPQTRASEDKTIDRLFGLYFYCEKKAGDFVYENSDLYENEGLDMFTICDADISQKRWVARLFRVTITILEVLLYRMSTKTANQVIRNALQKFPQNELLMAYVVRLKQLQGDSTEARFFLEKISSKFPKDEFLEFITFNSFLQLCLEMNYDEAKKLLEGLSQKFPQYSTLAENNLAYILISEGRIVEAIEKLEDIIRTEPWNINEVMVLNLFYLYDFYYLHSKERKKTIEEIIDRYAISFNKEVIVDHINRG